MSCGCENIKRMQDITRVRELARKAAKMSNEIYILYEKAAGIFDFCPESCEHSGEMIEYVFP